jgi:ankyrin repeat protein
MKNSPLLLLLAFSLMWSAPARADKVICDGNPLCLLAISPIIVGVLAVDAVRQLSKSEPKSEPKLEPKLEQIALAINNGKGDKLRSELALHPQLLKEKPNHLLKIAVKADNLDAITFLLDKGADPGDEKSEVLMYAKTVDVLKLLLSRGALANQFDLSLMRETLPSPAALDLISVVLNQRDTLTPDDTGAITLLSSAVEAKQADVVTLLLARGINPDMAPLGYGGNPALVQLGWTRCPDTDAICLANIERIGKQLIAQGANVNIRSTRGYTPLGAASENFNSSIVKLLQEAGAKE